MRPQHHGAAACHGLDEILPAQRRKTPAQQGAAGHGVVQRHFPQAVADPDIRRLRRLPPAAAARNPQARGFAQPRDFFEPLRVARHDQPLHVFHIDSCPRFIRAGFGPVLLVDVQPGRFLALARTGQQHHRASQAVAPGPAMCQQLGRGLRIELHVAEDALHRSAERTQPLGVGLGLRPDRRQRAVGGPGQPRQPQRARM